MSTYQWVALYTKANQEEIAVSNIQRQSFEAYCPMITRTRRHARRIESVRRPLFPSYVFVKIRLNLDRWRPLLSTRGVQSMVKFGDKIGVLPQSFVDELRSHDEAGDLYQFITPKVHPGDKVTISEGPFQDIIGRVLSLPERDRVWLLLDMMGQQVRISHRLSALIPA